MGEQATGAVAARVLLLAPMASELRPLVRRLHARRTQIAGVTAHAAVHEDRLFVACRIGVGPSAARRATRRLLDAVMPDVVVVSGIAGGVADTAPVGAILAPATVVDLDENREYRATGLPQHAKSGTVATSARLLSADELGELACRGVQAIDMETAAVAAECERSRRPWAAFRAISDRPGDGMVDSEVLGLVRGDGRADVLAAVKLVTRHPRRASALVALARSSTSCATGAARAAVTACRTGPSSA